MMWVHYKANPYKAHATDFDIWYSDQWMRDPTRTE